MCETENIFRASGENIPLGWLKLFIIGKGSNPSSRTVYIYKNSQIYSVLHTDTTGATKAISLPAKKASGSEYVCLLDNGDKSIVKVYPYVVNNHYINKNAEET